MNFQGYNRSKGVYKESWGAVNYLSSCLTA